MKQTVVIDSCKFAQKNSTHMIVSSGVCIGDLFPVPLLVLLVAHSEVHHAVSCADDGDYAAGDDGGAVRRMEDGVRVARGGSSRFKSSPHVLGLVLLGGRRGKGPPAADASGVS